MELKVRPKCNYPEPSPKCEGVGIIMLTLTDLDTYEKKTIAVCGHCYMKSKVDSQLKMIKEAKVREND